MNALQIISQQILPSVTAGITQPFRNTNSILQTKLKLSTTNLFLKSKSNPNNRESTDNTETQE